ncbi:MAG: isoprenoid biosynthesis glyoxalase ElbB [Spirochaetota bacterium]|nr:isoprenoid biosynthesis glyoxalase ElbB [Spirochaetota bacterium]
MKKYPNVKVGVVLSGCGVFDGSEIHEATITLLALDRAQAQIINMAPDADQKDVINHMNNESVSGEKRRILLESSRIARGDIKDIKDIKAGDIDALIFPGGFGAAKNLCTFALEGKDCKVNPDVERLITEMHKAKKPLAFLCIAPVLAAKVLGKHNPQITIGNDQATAGAIEEMGAKHIVCAVDDIAVDESNKIVTTPAYMLGPSIAHVAKGIEKCVEKVLKMTK